MKTRLLAPKTYYLSIHDYSFVNNFVMHIVFTRTSKEERHKINMFTGKLTVND